MKTQWVRKVSKSLSFLPESTVVCTLSFERFFTNPFSTNDPSVYAIFPQKLTFQQIGHCVDDSKHLSHDVDVGEGPLDPYSRITLPRGFKPTGVPWVNRSFQIGSQALDKTMMDLILVWLGQHASSPVWLNMTILPLSLMTELA
jgi:hypothetical protein